jgi:hypothetical protein
MLRRLISGTIAFAEGPIQKGVHNPNNNLDNICFWFWHIAVVIAIVAVSYIVFRWWNKSHL